MQPIYIRHILTIYSNSAVNAFVRKITVQVLTVFSEAKRSFGNRVVSPREQQCIIIIVAHMSTIFLYRYTLFLVRGYACLSSSISPQGYKRMINSLTLFINGNDLFGKIVGGEPFCSIVLVDSCNWVSYLNLVLQTSFTTLQQF